MRVCGSRDRRAAGRHYSPPPPHAARADQVAPAAPHHRRLTQARAHPRRSGFIGAHAARYRSSSTGSRVTAKGSKARAVRPHHWTA